MICTRRPLWVKFFLLPGSRTAIFKKRDFVVRQLMETLHVLDIVKEVLISEYKNEIAETVANLRGEITQNAG